MLFDIRMFRGLWFHSLDRGGDHPWVRALRLSTSKLGAHLDISRLESVLHDEIHRHQPTNAAELLGLHDLQNPALANSPAWAAVLPWEDFTLQESAARQREGRLFDTRQYGVELPIDLGSEAFGPSTTEVVQLCAKRLVHIVSQIRAEGVHPRKGRVRAIRLEKSHAFGTLRRQRFYVENGQHRAAVYGYLDRRRIPAKISRQSISLRDVASWAGVKNGYFSVDEAVFIFCRIFELSSH